MAKKIAVQMKDHTISGKDPMPVITFLQEFKSVCDVCGIPGGAAMWLFKLYPTSPAKAAVKAKVALSIPVDFYHGSALKFYSDIAQFLLKRYVTDDIIAKLDAEVRNLRQGSMIPAKFPQ